MSRSWIPMFDGLESDPEVISMSVALGMEDDHVVGKLKRLWSWADRTTADGFVPGISRDWIDNFMRKPGFCKAMEDAKWIKVDRRGVTFINFKKHMGNSAKSRARDAERKRASRSERTNVRIEPDKRPENVQKKCDHITDRQTDRQTEQKNKTKTGAPADSARDPLPVESKPQGSLPACLPAGSVRDALESIGVGNPALSLLSESTGLDVAIVQREWTSAHNGRARDPTSVLVSSLCRIARIELPKKSAPIGNSMRNDPAMQRLLSAQKQAQTNQRGPRT